MNVKERVLNVFNGLKVDRIPFLSYPGLIPIGEHERNLRNNGFGYWWIVSPLIIKNKKVERKTTYFYKYRKEYFKNTLKTAYGEIYEIFEQGGGYGTSLKKIFLLKEEKDYEIYEKIIKTEEFDVNKELYKEIESNLGDDGVIVSWLPKTPFQSILYELVGPENYAFHLFDYKENFLYLYQLLFKRYLKICEILSETEFEFFEIGDNITSEMIGLERFKKFILPVYKNAILKKSLKIINETLIKYGEVPK